MAHLVFLKDDLRVNIVNLDLINEICVNYGGTEKEPKTYLELRQYKLNRDEDTEELSQIVDYYEIQSDLLDESTENAFMVALFSIFRGDDKIIDFSIKENIDNLIKISLEKIKQSNTFLKKI